MGSGAGFSHNITNPATTVPASARPRMAKRRPVLRRHCPDSADDWCGEHGMSDAEGGEVELAEAFGVGDHIDRRDLPAREGQPEH